MKHLFAALLASASLAGCVVAPVDPGPYPLPPARYPQAYPAPRIRRLIRPTAIPARGR